MNHFEVQTLGSIYGTKDQTNQTQELIQLHLELEKLAKICPHANRIYHPVDPWTIVNVVNCDYPSLSCELDFPLEPENNVSVSHR